MKEYIKKFKNLGISVYVIDVKAEKGSRKFHGGRKRNIEDLNLDEYNFLGIDLKDSGLLCLDIEGHLNSVNNFRKFLKDNFIDEENLLLEKTMNNGLHVYFRNIHDIQNESLWNIYNGIHFDILTRRAFTTPSSFKGKKYEWIGDNFNNLKKIDDIPSTPNWILDLSKNQKKYYP